MPITTSTNLYEYSRYIVGDNSPYITIQQAINAANTAGGGIVLVRPGTYVENLTLFTAITIEGVGNEEIIINGLHTPPNAGIIQFKNLTLRSATDILNSVAAGTTVINISDCQLEVTNGYVLNLPNWTGNLTIERCESNGTNDGVITNGGTAAIYITDSSLGAGAVRFFIANGSTTVEQSNFACALSLSGAATDSFNLCTFARTLTLSDTLVANIINSEFNTGVNIPLTTTTFGLVSLSNVIINSSAANVITGTSTVEFGSITYLNSTGIAGTITKDFTTRVETGILKLSDATVGVLVATTGVVAAQNPLTVPSGGTGVAILTDHAVLVGSGAAAVTPIGVGATGELLTGVTGADPAFATSSNGNFTFTSATATVQRTLTISNTDNTAVASPANLQVTVGGATNTGDPFVNFLVTGAGTYSLGIDNTVANDPLKITSGATPSAGTDLFTMTSTGVITLNNDLDVTEGGTGVSTLTSHGVLLGNGAGDIGATAEGATGTILTGVTGNNPTWTTATYPSTAAVGDIIYGSALNTITGLAFVNTATRYIKNTGTGATLPEWGQVDMTNGVTGTLPVGNGGLGVADPTDHAVLVGSGNAAVTPIAVGTIGQLLIGATGADPAFGSTANADFTFTTATSGLDRTLTISNTDNTAVASSAHLQVTVGGTTSIGDPYINFLITGSNTYSFGIDNSHSDRLKITSGANPSSGTDLVTIETTGTLTAASTITATTGNLVSTAGNLLLPETATGGGAGIIKFNNVTFFHSYGTSSNTFIGASAGNTAVTLTGTANCALGYHGLLSLTTGSYNMAMGSSSLDACTTGSDNVGIGNLTLSDTVDGTYNIGIGSYACNKTTSATRNVGIGYTALINVLTGGYNTAIGYNSGDALTGAEASNLLLRNAGVVGESNAIRIGTNGTGNGQQNRCYIAGVVSMPNTSAFLAYNHVDVPNVTGQSLTYKFGTVNVTEIFDQNSDFNVNGTFTAPITGRYRFTGCFYITDTIAATGFLIQLVTSNRTYAFVYNRAAASTNQSMSINTLADMDAADTAYIDIAVTGEVSDLNTVSGTAVRTYFCGELSA